MSSDPMQQFLAWFEEASRAGLSQPEAVALATASPDGQPSARMVLYRGLSGGYPRFFTNYQSRKGDDLASNPKAALLFFWEPLGRQVRFEGTVEPLSPEESDQYFQARPRGHRINAWASAQSRPIASRDELVARQRALEAEYEGKEVPRPPFWGGFRLVPARIEFWTNGEDRFHDRRVYTREGSGWRAELLSP